MTYLENAIIHEIWKSFPVTLLVVEQVYREHKSFDKTIAILEMAQECKVDPLQLKNVKFK